MIGLQYQAEIPPYLGEYDGNEKGKDNFGFWGVVGLLCLCKYLII